MQFISNLRIAQRLALAFGVVGAAMLTMYIVTASATSTVKDHTKAATAKLDAHDVDGALAQIAKAQDAAGSAATTTLLICIGGLLIAAALAFVVSRSVTKPVNIVLARLQSLFGVCATGLGEALDAMADGDLTVRVTPVTPPTGIDSKDEIGQVAKYVDEVRNKLVGAIG